MSLSLQASPAVPEAPEHQESPPGRRHPTDDQINTGFSTFNTEKAVACVRESGSETSVWWSRGCLSVLDWSAHLVPISSWSSWKTSRPLEALGPHTSSLSWETPLTLWRKNFNTWEYWPLTNRRESMQRRLTRGPVAPAAPASPGTPWGTKTGARFYYTSVCSSRMICKARFPLLLQELSPDHQVYLLHQGGPGVRADPTNNKQTVCSQRYDMHTWC